MRVYLAASMFTPYERSFLDDCAGRLRAEGFEVFVPHEHGLVGRDATPEAVFAVDAGGVESSDAVLAVLDGSSVDDGTACEIGLFYGLKQRDPERKGVIGLLTDLRGPGLRERLKAALGITEFATSIVARRAAHVG